MIHINILTKSTNNPYYPNWDKNKFPETEFDIRANSNDDIDWDCVVVCQNICSTTTLKCKSGNLIYVSGEPPLMYPCPHSFVEQFDKVYLPHLKVKHRCKVLSHGFLSWTLGRGFKSRTHRYDFEALKNLEPRKTKLISIVSSNQTMMPGHNKRVSVIERLQKDYPEMIDVFGRGYKFVDFKADALLPYRFHICIENSSIPYYWTEKISDPIMAQCVPIYAGCTNISQYLGGKGYFTFDVEDYNSLKNIIETIILDSEGVYMSMKKDLEYLRKVLMEEQNLIPVIIEHINRNSSSKVITHTIKPIENCWGYKLDLLLIRFRRFLFKLYYSLFKKRSV